MKAESIALPGNIAVESESRTFFIYDNSSKSKLKFKIRSDDKIKYNGLTWTRDGRGFVGNEYILSDTFGISKGCSL